MLESTAGSQNPNEDWLKLSQRYLEFALELEKAGWLKEATLILWDAFSLPECDESLQLHSHRILQNWSDRLEVEGQFEESGRVRELMGIESAPPPPPAVLPPRRPIAESPRVLLEPPPSLDWMEEPPVVAAPPVSMQPFDGDFSPGGLNSSAEEFVEASDSWLTPPPDLGIAPPPPLDEIQPPARTPDFPTEVLVAPLPAREDPPRQAAEDIAAWMRSLGDEGLSTPTTPPPPIASPVTVATSVEPQMGLRSPLGAPREAFSSIETFPGEERAPATSVREMSEEEFTPPAFASQVQSPGPRSSSGEGLAPAKAPDPEPVIEAPPMRRPAVITSALPQFSPAPVAVAPPPPPPVEAPQNVGRLGADDQSPAPGGYRPAKPEAASEPAPVSESSSPPEFEVNLNGGEDRDALLRLLHRHPEHKGVRTALYRSFADDVAGLVRAFRDLVGEDPDEVYHVLNLARAFAHSGSDSMAILQFRKYVKLEATSEGYRELGEAYERMGKGELASQAFRRAEQLLAEEELDD